MHTNTNTATNNIRRILILSMLPVSVSAQATCVPDAPEMGDIGPGSELVCRELEGRFPGAVLKVDGRTIYSPEAVAVVGAVDGRAVSLRYELSGYTWKRVETGVGSITVPAPRIGLQTR